MKQKARKLMRIEAAHTYGATRIFLADSSDAASRRLGIEASNGSMASAPAVSAPATLAVSRSARLGFTLTELMIAVVVLLVVIAAAGKIFDTVTKVTGLSEATTSVLQEATTIERQLRQDMQTLAPEGFLGIRHVRVRNDIHVAGGGDLLDPSLSPLHYFRADQLVFFTNSLGGIQTYHQSAGSNHKGQGTTAFVYFGHGFQLPSAGPVTTGGGGVLAHDPLNDVFPWTQGSIPMVRTTFRTGGTNDNFNFSNAGTIDGTQPPPSQWLLVRQQAILVNDDVSAAGDNSKTVYLQNNITGRSIFLNDPFLLPRGSRELRNGRVDAAATLMHNVRNRVEFNGGTALDWLPDQRTRIANTMQYRRAEREAPSMHRVDQALTNAVIGSGCSNVRIEWTYDHRVGEYDPDGNPNNGFFTGFTIDPVYEQPWFGLTDLEHGVGNFSDGNYLNAINASRGETIFPANLEQVIVDTPTLQVMETFFGYNQTQPINNSLFVPAPTVGTAYTPWPSALRITLTLHDTNTRLTHGREVQFIVRLPKRVGQ